MNSPINSARDGGDIIMEGYYYCEVCKEYRSKHNRKRHDSCHYKCELCSTLVGSKRHRCLNNRLQWIGLVDQGRLTCYLLGMACPPESQFRKDVTTQTNDDESRKEAATQTENQPPAEAERKMDDDTPPKLTRSDAFYGRDYSGF